jgi:diguanylate cyclase (GGDEF)-like protein
MSTAASPVLNPIAPEKESAGTRPSAKVLARRVKQRRQILEMIAACYLLDASALLIYALAGTIPATIAPSYFAAGLAFVGLFAVLSETGFNDRFKDHYLVLPQSIMGMLIAIVFAYAVPETSIVFLCTLFTVFGFGSLRATPRQTALTWTIALLALAILFLQSDKHFAMPDGSRLERLATMLVFLLGFGRCMFIGIFSSSMRESLYQSGLKLKEAYRRIEELAELDELTGTLNRRCIMRVLEEQIASSQRTNASCSIALIDLDWFKRINDTFGHPTGDEVLRTFAITVFANIRPNDRFGRYGGEEFLLVFPDTDDKSAARILERLRVMIAELDWSAFSPDMRVTISAGVASLRDDENSDSILARADSALYDAKARGRDRIIVA